MNEMLNEITFENVEEGTDECVIENAAVVATILAGNVGNDQPAAQLSRFVRFRMNTATSNNVIDGSFWASAM